MADNLDYLLGRPARVATLSKQVFAVGALDDVITATLEYRQGPLAFLGTAMVIPDIARTAVWAEKERHGMRTTGPRLFVGEVGSKEWVEGDIDTVDTERDELEEFASNVRFGSKPKTGGPETLEATAVLEGIVESATTGTVDLDEVRARK